MLKSFKKLQYNDELHSFESRLIFFVLGMVIVRKGSDKFDLDDIRLYSGTCVHHHDDIFFRDQGTCLSLCYLPIPVFHS